MTRPILIGILVAGLAASGVRADAVPIRPQGTPSDARTATVEFLDVGQGDAILIRSPEGRTALIDTGRHDSVVDLLRERGVTVIDLAILTHRHIDHCGGMDAVLRTFPVRALIENGSGDYRSPSYVRLLEMVEQAGVPVSQPGDRPTDIALGSIRLTILPLPPEDYYGSRDPGIVENDKSIGVRVQFGDVSFLLTGDSNPLERRWWMGQAEVARHCADATILKIAHHGAHTGLDAGWLDLVRPQSAVVSMGIDVLRFNWTMPAREVMDLLRGRGLRLQNTALSGSVGYRTDGTSWEVFFSRSGSGVPAPQAAPTYASWQYLVALVYLAVLGGSLWRRRKSWSGLARPLFVLPMGLILLTLYGLVGPSFGIPTLFWHDRPVVQVVAGLGVMGLALLLARLARATPRPAGAWAVETPGAAAAPLSSPGLVDLILIRLAPADGTVGLPLILLTLPPALLPALRGETLVPSRADALAHLWLPAGLVLGLLATALAARLASRLRARLGSPSPRHRALAVMGGVLSLASLAALAWRAEVPPPASATLCLLLAVLGLVAHATRGRPARRYAMALALLAWVAVANGRDPYKLVFPDLAAYYRPKELVDVSYYRGMKEGMRGAGRPEVRDPGRVPRVGDIDALNQWRAVQRDQSRPTLVVVAVSGGGIAAAVWTAQCLEQLVATVPDFARRVRLITGASGGMVGAAHFVASIVAPPPARLPDLQVEGEGEAADEDEGPGTPTRPPEHHPFGPRRRDLVADLSRDCLTPVASHLVLADLPSIFWPWRVPVDRGQVLERALERNTGGVLAVPFAALAAGEAEGWRPSLVVTPMLVEEGRPMIISNLDLRHLDEIEFFRLFPRAHAFRLSTAVRMNAAFPYVTPATNLPTSPPRRVVDAGYFDNYGVVTACSWIERNQDWLLEHVAGVVLIQIRAYPMDAGEAGGGPAAYLARGMQWATSPLEGYTTARRRSMIDRNNNLIARLQDSFQRRTPNQLFFSTVVFESYEDAALSWTMTRADQRKLSAALESAENRLALKRVQLYLRATFGGIGGIRE